MYFWIRGLQFTAGVYTTQWLVPVWSMDQYNNSRVLAHYITLSTLLQLTVYTTIAT